MLKKSNRIFPSVTMVAVLICGMGVPSWAAPERGGATPEEVFNRFNAGTEAQNWEEIAACLSPDGLAEMNAMMVVMGGMMVAFANMGEEMAETMGDPEQAQSAASEVSGLEKKFEELLVRHGIDAKAMEEVPVEGDELPEAFQSPAFFADIMGFIDELPDDKEGGASESPFSGPKGPLENLVIDGDRATATVGGEPGEFVRVDGRWYLDFNMEKDEGPGEMEATPGKTSQ